MLDGVCGRLIFRFIIFWKWFFNLIVIRITGGVLRKIYTEFYFKGGLGRWFRV